eukprot:scaffold2180_cov137-Isochrysis_galbana.AAC.2
MARPGIALRSPHGTAAGMPHSDKHMRTQAPNGYGPLPERDYALNIVESARACAHAVSLSLGPPALLASAAP